VPKGEESMRSTPKVALTGLQLDPRLVRLVRLVRPFPQGAVWKFLSGIDRFGMAGLIRTTHPRGWPGDAALVSLKFRCPSGGPPSASLTQ
jgi:hypothetical protein